MLLLASSFRHLMLKVVFYTLFKKLCWRDGAGVEAVAASPGAEHARCDQRAATSALSAEGTRVPGQPSQILDQDSGLGLRAQNAPSPQPGYCLTTCRVWCFWVLHFVTLLPLPTLSFYFLVLLVDGHAATCV